MKFKPILIVLFLLLLVSAASVAQASNNLYVGGAGAADAGNCQSTPCATIAYAVSQAESSDIINVAAGTYTENLLINKDLTLTAPDGRGVTTIQGISGVGALGTILIDGTTTAVTIEGFTVLGIDNNTPGVENAAVYLRGSHSGTVIQDNDIVAQGDAGLMSEYGATVTNFLIDENVFSGQTFVGAEPGDCGFSSQFTNPNVPRQLVVMGNGGGDVGSAKATNITFTNNQIIGTAGGPSTVSGCEVTGQGNTLVTLDAANSTITGNSFDGVTSRYATSLRVRRPDTTIANNFFISDGLGTFSGHVFFENASTFNMGDLVSTNTLDKGVYGDPTATAGTLGIAIKPALSAASPGDTINVASGTYVEDLVIDKAITLLGPNASINPNTGTRVAEAVIHPEISEPDPAVCEVMVYIEVSDVTIKGFTFDGDNPDLTSSVIIDGADVDACEILAGYEGMGNIVVENNILKHSTYSGIDFYNYTNNAATAGNYIRYNLFENIGETTYNWGVGILIYNNFYAEITDNVLTGVRTGIQTGNFYRANPGTTGSISNNEIGVWRLGIFHNLTYSDASPFTISDNIITAETYPGATKWNGVLLSSIGGAVNALIADNTINVPNTVSSASPGYTAGYNVWNVTTTAPIAITGGTVSGGDYGIFVNNYEGYNSNAGNTAIAIDGVALSDSAIAGLYVKDSPDNTNAATVYASIQNSTINDSGIGILVDGEDASVQAEQNRIYSNTQNMVNNNPGVTMDASPNWWGTPCDPSSTIVGLVDYSPWWSDLDGNSLVDEDYLNDLGNVVPDSASGELANLILACAPPLSTVEFEENGTFNGGIIVTTPGLTINLNGGTVGAGSPAFTIAAPDVTIQGPGVLNGNNNLSPAVLVDAGGDNFTLKDVEVREWADGVEVAADVTSFKLFDNWIHSNTDAGLQVNSNVTLGGVVSIQGNLFKENGGNGIQHDGNGTLPASYNSWGDVGGPAGPVGDGVSANVTFAPWTFAEVYLDVEPNTEAILWAVNEDDAFDVALKIEAANLYGTSFVFNYDDALLTYNGVTFSSPWDGTCLPLVGLAANEIGYQCALTSGPEWNGGTVATFNFTANGSGLSGNGPWSAVFDISSAVADTSAGAVGGAKVFVNNAGFNAPSVPDRDIADANDGQVDIIGLANFTGFVDLQGRSNDSGAVIQVYDQADESLATLMANASTVAGGGYTTAYLAPNQLSVGSTYWFQIDRDLYLPATAVADSNYVNSKLLADRPTTTLATIVLLGGDATNDDVIDIGDASCIGGQYGQLPGACGTGTGDVNEDTLVNILDLTLMGGNFNKISSPWSP
ncbi:MAG: right-handed parallel beta-helix repeat-containing protein [Ardenticatenaceae bacterium]|nr:right-handed parallel beta-helix repeat-containing protein [Ardenticatenaceae bacterium]